METTNPAYDMGLWCTPHIRKGTAYTRPLGGKTMIFLLGMFGKRNDDMDLS
jgi:hypothetical protein